MSAEGSVTYEIPLRSVESEENPYSELEGAYDTVGASVQAACKVPQRSTSVEQSHNDVSQSEGVYNTLNEVPLEAHVQYTYIRSTSI